MYTILGLPPAPPPAPTGHVLKLNVLSHSARSTSCLSASRWRFDPWRGARRAPVRAAAVVRGGGAAREGTPGARTGRGRAGGATEEEVEEVEVEAVGAREAVDEDE